MARSGDVSQEKVNTQSLEIDHHVNNCFSCKQVNVTVNESLEFYPGFILPYNYDFALESTKDIFLVFAI